MKISKLTVLDRSVLTTRKELKSIPKTSWTFFTLSKFKEQHSPHVVLFLQVFTWRIIGHFQYFNIQLLLLECCSRGRWTERPRQARSARSTDDTLSQLWAVSCTACRAAGSLHCITLQPALQATRNWGEKWERKKVPSWDNIYISRCKISGGAGEKERWAEKLRCLAGDSRLGSAWSHCWLSTRPGPGLTGKFSHIDILICSNFTARLPVFSPVHLHCRKQYWASTHCTAKHNLGWESGVLFYY